MSFQALLQWKIKTHPASIENAAISSVYQGHFAQLHVWFVSSVTELNPACAHFTCVKAKMRENIVVLRWPLRLSIDMTEEHCPPQNASFTLLIMKSNPVLASTVPRKGQEPRGIDPGSSDMTAIAARQRGAYLCPYLPFRPALHQVLYAEHVRADKRLLKVTVDNSRLQGFIG
jgi:hypothetical protein